MNDDQVYEESKVITPMDLLSLANGFAYQINVTPKWRLLRRIKHIISLRTVETLAEWLMAGKPSTYNYGDKKNA